MGFWRRRRRGAIRGACLFVIGWTAEAPAFVLLEPVYTGTAYDLVGTLESSPRWSAGSHPETGGAGLQGGIQVAVEENLVGTLTVDLLDSVAADDARAVEAVLLAAFAAWESPVLSFEITFDGPVERGTDTGAELDLFAVRDSDPVFFENAYFGVTFWQTHFVADRQLSNGQVVPGLAFSRTDIFLNLDQIRGLGTFLDRSQKLNSLQRLLMHEIGHALGVGHPNELIEANLDIDGDPLNQMPIDPFDPFDALMFSISVDRNAIMSNRPRIDATLFTVLQNDDRAARDVLYPDIGSVPATATPTATASPTETSSPSATATATATPSTTSTTTPPPPTIPTSSTEPCPGDCDEDDRVTIDELIRGVGMALGLRADGCHVVYGNGDRDITINELVRAVRAALNGCGSPDRIELTPPRNGM